jgi:hypothetical protein
MPEDQRRAAVLRKTDSANGARVAVRRPSIVSCVVVGVESSGCEGLLGALFRLLLELDVREVAVLRSKPECLRQAYLNGREL